MLGTSEAFSGYSADDIPAAKQFYGEVLGLDLNEQMGGVGLRLASGAQVFIYPKPNHEPATYTVLNFSVENLEEVVKELTVKGVEFERYEGFDQDELGIATPDHPGQGPRIAWFKDPAGNILSLLQGMG